MTYKDIRIVFEDNHLLVVEKPYGVPVQADSSGDADLLNMLKQYLVESKNKSGNAYLGLVHRLDRPVGGVMVFAKTSKAAERLQEKMQNGDMEKRYFAVVDGIPRFRTDKLKCYLKKDRERNIVSVVPALSEGAKYAELDYKTLATSDNNSLLQVTLVTGRSHQIRVQLANMGNPILGDVKYGRQQQTPYRYPALWAVQLRFDHPISGTPMTFRVFPPKTEPWTNFEIDAFLNVTIEHEE